jgi:hypothetical protein
LNPGQAPFGPDQFPIGFSSAHLRFKIRCTSEIEEVVVVGELAYTRCQDSLSLTLGADGEATELAGHRMTM